MKKKIVFIPYDMDTALGTNNEGILAFDYNLEDTDQVGGADVFNGQDSVLWCNLRDAFGDEIMEMAQELAAAGLTWEEVSRRFKEHQSIWSIAIFNADAKAKYHDPLTEDNIATYVSMDQGPKTLQRDYFGSHRFAYLFSKWFAGDARKNAITLKAYATSDITLTPFDDIYGHVRFGSSDVIKKCTRNTPALFECSLDNLNDTETYVFSAPSIKAIGDLSGLKVGFADFSPAINLQEIVIGNSSSSYSNPNLKELYFGNNQNLKKVDVRNCTELTMTVDLSGCTNIEDVYFSGTKVTGVVLPNGAPVKNLYLPSTVTDLTLRNLTKLSTFNMPSYSNISTLRLENNASVVNMLNIFNAIPNGSRVRMLGINFSFSSESAWNTFLTKLKTMRGLDENNNTTDMAQLSGRIYVSTITGYDFDWMAENFPNVTMTYGTKKWTLYFYNEDGTELLYISSATNGSSAGTYTPTSAQKKPNDAQYTYSFAGWSLEPGGDVTSSYYTNMRSDRNVYAVWNATLRTYTVYWYYAGASSTAKNTRTGVPYGSIVKYATDKDNISGEEQDVYPENANSQYNAGNLCFSHWEPSPRYPITGETSFVAVYNDKVTSLDLTEITDTWAEIGQAISDGTYSEKYKVGNYKYLDCGTEGTIRMQIVAMDLDQSADGFDNHALSWMALDPLATKRAFNSAGSVIWESQESDGFYLPNTTSSHVYLNANLRYTYGQTAYAKLKVTANAGKKIQLYCSTNSYFTVSSISLDGNPVSPPSTSATYYVDETPNETKTYIVEVEVSHRSGGSYTNSEWSFHIVGQEGYFTCELVETNTITRNVPVGITDDHALGYGEYPTSPIGSYLNGTFLGQIDQDALAIIKPTRKFLEYAKVFPRTTGVNPTEIEQRSGKKWFVSKIFIPTIKERTSAYEKTGAHYGSVIFNQKRGSGQNNANGLFYMVGDAPVDRFNEVSSYRGVACYTTASSSSVNDYSGLGVSGLDELNVIITFCT